MPTHNNKWIVGLGNPLAPIPKETEIDRWKARAEWLLVENETMAKAEEHWHKQYHTLLSDVNNLITQIIEVSDRRDEMLLIELRDKVHDLKMATRKFNNYEPYRPRTEKTGE